MEVSFQQVEMKSQDTILKGIYKETSWIFLNQIIS